MNGTRPPKLLGKLIALTLTYREHHYVCPVRQFQETFLQVLLGLKRCSKEFILSPELTDDGNIHYHATVWIHDLVKWHKSILPSFRRNGFTKVKSRVDCNWTKYVIKDVENMEAILDVKLPFTEQTDKLIVKCKNPLDDNIKDAIDIRSFYNIA